MSRTASYSLRPEIVAALDGGGMSPPSPGRRFYGHSVGNSLGTYWERESMLLWFDDPALEQEYREYNSRASRRGDLLSLCVSTLVGLLYLIKGSFTTFPAQVLRALAVAGIICNLTRLVSLKASPTFSELTRRPVVISLSWYQHLVMACLPPLSYSSFKLPSTKFGIYWVSLMLPLA
jgi:hypothetical protein